MVYLIDSHAIIWFSNGDSQMPSNVIKEIKDIKNDCYVSIVSIWELAIKINLGKLSISSGFENLLNFLSENDIQILPISLENIITLNKLASHHRDPFDRMIIAQAISERMTIITRDSNFSYYTNNILWK